MGMLPLIPGIVFKKRFAGGGGLRGRRRGSSGAGTLPRLSPEWGVVVDDLLYRRYLFFYDLQVGIVLHGALTGPHSRWLVEYAYRPWREPLLVRRDMY